MAAINGVFMLNVISERHIFVTQSARDRRHGQAEHQGRASQGAEILNHHPERVSAPWFQTGNFFDAQDLAQVKYEMLRHVSQEGASKVEAAALFGLSRPASIRLKRRSIEKGSQDCCRVGAARRARTSLPRDHELYRATTGRGSRDFTREHWLGRSRRN